MKYWQALFLFVFVASCSNKNEENVKRYFDINAYFKSKTDSLQQENPVVNKTVIQNGQSEVRQVQIDNWKTELELFAASDINKPAWKKSYQIITKGNAKEYVAKDEQLKTRKISIEWLGGSVRHISILNVSKNILYSSFEQLDYYPDSLYSIKKRQTVRVIGTNSYTILARF